ncbi:MAG: hypothetical protein J0L85_12875 [Zoogloea sp.]|nr:hypothetical protein [Zoogloea sp.]
MRSFSTMLQLLVERAGPNLTEDDLKKLDGGCEMAALLLYNLKTVSDGISLLVGSDSNNSGGLQDRSDISEMMALYGMVLDLTWALQQMETNWLDREPVTLASVRGMAA